MSVYELPATIPNNFEVNVAAEINDWLAGVPSGDPGNPTRLVIPPGVYRVDQTVTVTGKTGWYVEQHGLFRTDDPTGDGSPRSAPSRDARSRAHVRVAGLSDVIWDGLAVQGANRSWESGNPHYVARLEAQHGIDVQNSAVDVVNASIRDVWGDFAYYGRSPGDRTKSSGHFHDSECMFSGRQGISATHALGVEFDHLTLRGVQRSAFDLEPASSAFQVEHVSIHDITQWGSGLNFVACGSSSPVSYVDVFDCTVFNGPLTMVVNGAGTTKAHWAVYRNRSTGRFGSIRPGSLAFGAVTDVLVCGNVLPMNPARGNYGVSFNGCTQGYVLWNDFVGARAATYIYQPTDPGGVASVDCQSDDNRIVADGPYDCA